VEQALQQFRSSIPGVERSHQSYVFLRLLKAARTDGTISLYRPTRAHGPSLEALPEQIPT
jgi:hypothetical protein